MFSFCLERLRTCENWVEHSEWTKFFLKVRLTRQCSRFRRLARMMSQVGPELVSEIPNLKETELALRVGDLQRRIDRVYAKIVQLLDELVQNRGGFRDPQASTLDSLLKQKKNIIQKSSRLSKNFLGGVRSKQRVIFAELGRLIESEKILQTALLLVNLVNFREGFYFGNFLQNLHRMLRLFATSCGGIPLLFRNPRLSKLIEKSLGLTHRVPLDRITGLFGSLSLDGSSQSVYSRLLRSQTELAEHFDERQLANCHQHVFFRALNDAVTLLISVYGSIYVMSKSTDLIHTFISLAQFLRSEPVHRQAFALVIKERLVMKLFLTILDVDDPQLLQKMHREVLLCMQILTRLFPLATPTFYLHHESIWRTLSALGRTIADSTGLLSPRNLADLQGALADLEANLRPLRLLQKDLGQFVSYLKEQSRYTHNNIQTLLSNKNTRFDDEREFPEDDLSKRLARLRDDFLPFFGLGRGPTLKASLANLGLMREVLRHNPSTMQKLVDNDCFSPIVMLIQISTFVLKSLMEGSDFSTRLAALLGGDVTHMKLAFFSVFERATDIVLIKLKFKLREESHSKEYENVSLFQNFLIVLKLISDFFPNLVLDLVESRVLASEDWHTDRLFPERKNTAFKDISPNTRRLLTFITSRDDRFFDLVADNPKYGERTSRREPRPAHWR